MTPLRTPHFVRFLALAGALVVLARCGGGPDEAAQTDTSDLAVPADEAVRLTMIAAGDSPPMRPSAQMGIYSGLFLSGQGFLPSSSAVQGVIAESLYHARPTQERIDATYQLLEEFATVLQVDITDLLNRSSDRASTLDEYLEGLRNITARSEQKNRELEQYIDTLGEEQRTQRRTVSSLERQREDALEGQDFVQAGELQQSVAEQQSTLARLESDLDLQTSLQQTFEELLEISQERITAIDANREVLIAGLRVVEVPGVEDLGILDSARGGRRRGTLGF